MHNLPPVIASFQGEAAPISDGERSEIIDVLRGFALLGILLVNMALFTWPVHFLFSGIEVGDGALDEAADALVNYLASGKFYPLFSFLFGVGMAIQLQRADERGVGFTRLYLRRMLVLLGFGLVHAFFIWEGDILILYAVLGTCLVAFRRCKPKTLAIWIGCLLILPTLIYGGLWVLALLLSFSPLTDAAMVEETVAWSTAERELGERNLEIFANGSFGEIMLQRAKNTIFLYSMSFVFAPIVFAMFLAGLYAGTRNFLRNPEEHLPLFRRTLVLGLFIGIPGNLLFAASHEFGISETNVSWSWSVVYAAMLGVACPAMMLAYVSAIVLLFQKDRWRRSLLFLAPVGRMALSNYLLQSIICTTLLYSYGFGLYGSVGRATGIGLALVIFVFQIVISRWWMRRFQFGPAEWLWRTLVYRKPQSMRRAVAS